MPVYRMLRNHPEDVEYTGHILNSDECDLQGVFFDEENAYFQTKSKISESAKKVLNEKEIILYLEPKK